MPHSWIRNEEETSNRLWVYLEVGIMNHTWMFVEPIDEVFIFQWGRSPLWRLPSFGTCTSMPVWSGMSFFISFMIFTLITWSPKQRETLILQHLLQFLHECHHLTSYHSFLSCIPITSHGGTVVGTFTVIIVPPPWAPLFGSNRGQLDIYFVTETMYLIDQPSAISRPVLRIDWRIMLGTLTTFGSLLSVLPPHLAILRASHLPSTLTPPSQELPSTLSVSLPEPSPATYINTSL